MSEQEEARGELRSETDRDSCGFRLAEPCFLEEEEERKKKKKEKEWGDRGHQVSNERIQVNE